MAHGINDVNDDVGADACGCRAPTPVTFFFLLLFLRLSIGLIVSKIQINDDDHRECVFTADNAYNTRARPHARTHALFTHTSSIVFFSRRTCAAALCCAVLCTRRSTYPPLLCCPLQSLLISACDSSSSSPPVTTINRNTRVCHARYSLPSLPHPCCTRVNQRRHGRHRVGDVIRRRRRLFFIIAVD